MKTRTEVTAEIESELHSYFPDTHSYMIKMKESLIDSRLEVERLREENANLIRELCESNRGGLLHADVDGIKKDL